MDQEIKDAFESIAKAMDARKEAQELALICAQDIVDAWPTLTMRALGSMTGRIETLKQALEAAK
jgi:hypothetical protein